MEVSARSDAEGCAAPPRHGNSALARRQRYVAHQSSGGWPRQPHQASWRKVLHQSPCHLGVHEPGRTTRTWAPLPASASPTARPSRDRVHHGRIESDRNDQGLSTGTLSSVALPMSSRANHDRHCLPPHSSCSTADTAPRRGLVISKRTFLSDLGTTRLARSDFPRSLGARASIEGQSLLDLARQHKPRYSREAASRASRHMFPTFSSDVVSHSRRISQ